MRCSISEHCNTEKWVKKVQRDFVETKIECLKHLCKETDWVECIINNKKHMSYGDKQPTRYTRLYVWVLMCLCVYIYFYGLSHILLSRIDKFGEQWIFLFVCQIERLWNARGKKRATTAEEKRSAYYKMSVVIVQPRVTW